MTAWSDSLRPDGGARASIVVTLISLFLVGASRGLVTGRAHWPGALQALGPGIVAGAVAYAAGGIVAAATATP